MNKFAKLYENYQIKHLQEKLFQMDILDAIGLFQVINEFNMTQKPISIYVH